MSYRNPSGNYRPASSGPSSYQPQRNNYRQFNSKYSNNGHANNYGKYNGSNNQYQAQHQKKAYGRSSGYQARGNYSNVYNQASGNNNYSQQENQYQLWMGDLDPNWDEKSIIQIWSAFGETPTSVKIIKDKNAEPRIAKPAYCFVSFASQKSVSTAILKNGLQIPGSTKVFKLNWASGSSSGSGSGAGSYSNDNLNRSSSKQDYSIFVGDLNSDVTEPILFDKFNKKYPNQVKQVKIMFDSVTKLSKGFGFIRFTSQVIQEKALNEMNGVLVNNRPIRVGMAAGSANYNISQDSASKYDAVEPSSITLSQPQPSLNQYTDPNNSTLIVKGLSSKFTEDELANSFIAFGDIIYCKLSNDLNTGFIKYYLRGSAEAALLVLHGSIINDCYLKISWGKSNEIESDSINFEPNDSSNYIKSKPSPSLYGSFGAHNVRFDRLSKQQVAELPSSLIEESEPLPVNKLNEVYIKSKIHRYELLESALF